MGDDGPQYVYIRAADAIERDIRAGRWAFGARLPGKRRLAERYGVAELTVRSAVRVLQERGLVRVLPSSGVYVMWQPPSPDLQRPGLRGSRGRAP